MTQHLPISRLYVHRCFASGETVLAGQIAQNPRGVYFQYDPGYLEHHNLSPFKLGFNSSLPKGPPTPHSGLHGVFADSLPDGWGLLLMDRVFRRHGIQPHQITALDRLAYVGDHGMGALTYSPVSEILQPEGDQLIDIARLGTEAEALYEGTADEVLPQLAVGGTSAGARPKTLVYFDPEDRARVATVQRTGWEPWLVKFSAKTTLLGYEEGLCEAAYLRMANQAGIDVPEWVLVDAPTDSPAIAWLATRRFDCTASRGWQGRYHAHTLCGLLDADFRQPSLDYEDIIKVSQVLCQRPAAGKEQFKRAIFNLFAGNQDDHSKNWTFLLDDLGDWHVSPAYDVTFSPTPYGEHTTAFGGYGKAPVLKAMKALARQANFRDWAQAQRVMEGVVDALRQWDSVSVSLGVSKETRKMVGSHLDALFKENRHLLSRS